MKNLLNFFRKNYELIAYSVLVVLLFCSCFFSVFAWIAVGYVIFLALLLHDETKLFGLILFLVCFYALSSYQTFLGITLGEWLVALLILIMCVLYIIRVIKREQKLNWRTLIPIGLFLIYIVLPFHECNLQSFLPKLFFFLSLYIIFEERKKIDFRIVTRFFVFGLIISSTFALLRNVSPLLTEHVNFFDYNSNSRFTGLLGHPNYLARLVMVAICSILILKYKNKISTVEFLLELSALFAFGYLTISRMFIITTAAGIGIFALFDLVRRKNKSLPLLSIMLVIICVEGLVFLNTTKLYLERIQINSVEVSAITDLKITNLDDLFAGKSETWKQDVFEGKEFFDPGRSGLREMYLSDWSSSQKTIWLGRGVGRPAIGQMYAHNLYIQELWEHGIVGYLLYGLIILGSLNWKKLKQIKRWFPFLIVLIPYFLTTFIEPCVTDCLFLGPIIAALGCLEQIADKATAEVQPKTETEPLNEK